MIMKRFNQNEKEETSSFFKKRHENVFRLNFFLKSQFLVFFNEKSYFWRKYLSESYKAK